MQCSEQREHQQGFSSTVLIFESLEPASQFELCVTGGGGGGVSAAPATGGGGGATTAAAEDKKEEKKEESEEEEDEVWLAPFPAIYHSMLQPQRNAIEPKLKSWKTI